MEGLQDYLSWKIKISVDKKRASLGQPHNIKNMEKKLGKSIQDVKSHKTPGTHKFLIVRHMTKSEKISTKDQQEYWLGVGMLLYLMKHLHPDLANMTRNCWKPTMVQTLLPTMNSSMWSSMFWIWLKIEPMGNHNKPWEITCFSNSNYVGDLVSRRSISGFILNVLGILVSWQSKSQKPYLRLLRKHSWFSFWEAWKFLFLIQSWKEWMI